MSAPIEKKAPPHNEDAEQYIVGAVLHDPSCLPEVSEILGSNSFYSQRNREIFDALLDLRDLDREVTLDNAVIRLQEKGQGREDDFSLLLGISDPYAASVKNAVASAKLVKRCSLQRRQRQLAQEMLEKPDLDREKIKSELAEIGTELAHLDGVKSDPWELFTLKNAYAAREKLLWIIYGLFTLPSLSIVYGAPATLKSFLLAFAAVCVAAGLPFLGRVVIQFPTMWIDFDNGSRRSFERFEAIARAHHLPENTPFYFYSMPNPWLNLQNLRDIESLIQRCLALGVKLICIDNLGLVTGGADENSAEMILIMGNLRLLAERTGAAVVVIHHERKSGGIGARAGESLRGHSSIEAALDLALQIEREPHGNIITIKSTKTRDLTVLPFGAEFRFEHKPGTGELETASFIHYALEDVTSDGAIERVILETLREKPLLNQKQVFSEIKPVLEAGTHRIRSVLEKLEKSGKVIANSGNRGAKLYMVN